MTKLNGVRTFPSLICFFIVRLFLYWEKVTSYEKFSHNRTLEVQILSKISALDRFSIKMKNCKTLHEVLIASHLKDIFQSPPTHRSSDKILLCLWNKNFITEIYRKIQTFTFKEFQECGSWASRNDAVQMLFLTPNRNMFAGKFVKSERVLAVLLEQFVVNVNLVEIGKMSGVFWAKLYCKMSDLFR